MEPVTKVYAMHETRVAGKRGFVAGTLLSELKANVSEHRALACKYSLLNKSVRYVGILCQCDGQEMLTVYSCPSGRVVSSSSTL